MKIPFAAFFLSISLSSTAQVQILNRSLIDSTLSFLYIGVENKIELLNAPKKQVRFEITNGFISKTGPGTATAKLVSGDSSIILCYSGDSLLARKAFKVDTIPAPYARFGNITHFFATVEDIVANSYVVIALPNCYYKHSLKPLGFRFRIDNAHNEDNYKYSKYMIGGKLNEEQISLIKQCVPGVRLIIDDVRTDGKGVFSKKALSFVVVLK
jgi:hypothetical protein